MTIYGTVYHVSEKTLYGTVYYVSEKTPSPHQLWRAVTSLPIFVFGYFEHLKSKPIEHNIELNSARI